MLFVRVVSSFSYVRRSVEKGSAGVLFSAVFGHENEIDPPLFG